MKWHCSTFELNVPSPPCVKHTTTKAISAICNNVVCKLPFIERKVEINIVTESYKTPELKSACRDLKKEAIDLNFLTQFGNEDCGMSKVSSEGILTHSPGSPDSDKNLTMEDMSMDGEHLGSPTQAKKNYLDLVDPNSKELKVVAVIAHKFSKTAKKLSPISMLDGKTEFSSLLTSPVMLNHCNPP
jgi:hypothetical protein